MICALLPPSMAVATAAGRDPDQQHVIEADAVEAVFQRENTLDLVRFDHGVEQVGDGESFLF